MKNISSPLVDDFSMDIEDDQMLDRFSQTFSLYMFGLIFICGVSGNCWVLHQVLKNKKKMIRITNIFVFNLALADLVLILFLPVLMSRIIVGEWIFGTLVCKAYFMFDGVNKFASVAFITLLSMDRYLAICHPISSRRFRTPRTAMLLVVPAWLIICSAMMPVFLYTEVTVHMLENNETFTHCSFMQLTSDNETSINSSVEFPSVFTFCTFTLCYVLPLLLISLFYSKLVKRLRRRNFIMETESSSVVGSRSAKIGKRKIINRRMSFMVFIIVLAYTICWLPYWIFQVGLEMYKDEFVVKMGTGFKLFSLIAYGMQIGNSALNPLLYALGMENHRRRLRRTLRKIFCFCLEDWDHRMSKESSTLKQITKPIRSASKIIAENNSNDN